MLNGIQYNYILGDLLRKLSSNCCSVITVVDLKQKTDIL